MTPDPADFPTLLAAYADGELDAAGRAAVERWLAAHPEGWDELRAQQQLSPENRALWRAADPPAPGEADWERVKAAVAARLRARAFAEPAARPAWHRRTEAVLLAAGLGLTAAVVAFVLVGPWYFAAPPQLVSESVRNPGDGLAVLRVATDAEVDVRRVDGAHAGGWLPVGGVPLAAPLALATGDELDVEEAEAHPGWPAGGPQVKREPAEPPVLWPNR